MNPVVGWSLAAVAIVAGYFGWGWPGVALGLTVITFWLLLQFNRAVRVMRAAGGRPVGLVKSAVMLQAGLVENLTMLQMLQRTGSLGERLGQDTEPERWRWHDAGGDAVVTDWQGGRLRSWSLVRGPATEDTASAEPVEPVQAPGA
jgi:hypothetical protein